MGVCEVDGTAPDAGRQTDYGKLLEDPDIELDPLSLYCKPLFEHPEAVRFIDPADAAQMQRLLLDGGVTAAVLAR